MQTECVREGVEKSKVKSVFRYERIVHSLPEVMAGGVGWGK